MASKLQGFVKNEDVGTPFITSLEGKRIYSPIGYLKSYDIGKAVYEVDGCFYQIENEEQRDRRLAKPILPEKKIPKKVMNITLEIEEGRVVLKVRGTVLRRVSIKVSLTHEYVEVLKGIEQYAKDFERVAAMAETDLPISIGMSSEYLALRSRFSQYLPRI